MKQLFILIFITCFLIKADAPKEENKYWSIAIFNTENAKPSESSPDCLEKFFIPALKPDMERIFLSGKNMNGF